MAKKGRKKSVSQPAVRFGGIFKAHQGVKSASRKADETRRSSFEKDYGFSPTAKMTVVSPGISSQQKISRAGFPSNLSAIGSSRELKKAIQKDVRDSPARKIREEVKEKAEVSSKKELVKAKSQRIEQIRKVAGQVAGRIDAKVQAALKSKTVSRRVVRRGPRPVLDLRPRPEREVPVKQHGFKEGEISNSNFLFN
jgi:hypothetical protein